MANKGKGRITRTQKRIEATERGQVNTERVGEILRELAREQMRRAGKQ